MFDFLLLLQHLRFLTLSHRHGYIYRDSSPGGDPGLQRIFCCIAKKEQRHSKTGRRLPCNSTGSWALISGELLFFRLVFQNIISPSSSVLSCHQAGRHLILHDWFLSQPLWALTNFLNQGMRILRASTMTTGSFLVDWMRLLAQGTTEIFSSSSASWDRG